MEAPRRRYFFADAGTSKNCFAANGKIKTDVRAHEARELAALPPGELLRHSDPAHVMYHRVPLEKVLPPSAWCVDIKAAYPTTMRNMGAISEETYGWCMDNLKKAERLKAVGMIAGSKYVEQFENGRCVHRSREDNPLRPWFFDTCDYVGQVMKDVSEGMGRGFLFFWVDGVFADVADPRGAVEHLSSYGYEATAERIERIRWSASGKYILFRKGGKDTYLCVPRKAEFDDPELVSTLRDLNTVQHANVERPEDIRQGPVPGPPLYAPFIGPVPF